MSVPKKRTTALDIPPPESMDKPLTQRLLSALEFSDPVFDNLIKAQDREFVDFNFKVPLAFRTDFKKTAASWNMSNKDLMMSCYKMWIDRYARTPEEAQEKIRTARLKAESQE